MGNDLGRYYAIPFDIHDPVHTPRGLVVDNPEARALVMKGLTSALKSLGDADVSPLSRWGDVQFAIRNGEKIPIPGGDGNTGMFSVIYAPLNKKEKGYNPVIAGNSYIQVVTWNDDGTPDAHAILTYSQSPDPDSPWYDDMTRLYSNSKWIKLPFTDEDIESQLVRRFDLDSGSLAKNVRSRK